MDSPTNKRVPKPIASQLEFGDIAAGAAWTKLTVRRADGRQVPFDAHKLAESLSMAGQPGEDLDTDTALSLAHAAALFLRRSQPSDCVTTGRIAELAEGVLTEMGYTAAARDYARRFGTQAQEVARQVQASPGSRNAIIEPDRLEGFFEALAVEAGLQHDDIAELVSRTTESIRASGLRRPTAALIREWFAAVLRDQAMDAHADRLTHVSLPMHTIDEALHGRALFENEAAGDPDRAAYALAERLAESYALDAVLPSEAAEAHLRGQIHVLGLGHPLKLDTLDLDLEGLKHAGVLSPRDDRGAPPAAEPAALIRQLGEQTDILRPFAYGRLSWSAINYGLAPYLNEISDGDLRGLAQVIVFDFARRHAAASNGPGVELRLHWDPPNVPGGALHGPEDNSMPSQEAIDPARHFLEATLDVLADLADQGVRLPGAAFAVHLSPYFFGAPDADRLLDHIGRIALGPIPLTLRYESADALPLDLLNLEQAWDTVGQTVVVDLARTARLAPNLDTFIALFDDLIDLAVAALLAKHRFLERAARHRNGPLALLRKPYGDRPLVDLNALRYRVAVAGLPECVHAITGVPWHESPDAATVAETIVVHLVEACEGWASAAKRPIVPGLIDIIDAGEQGFSVCDRGDTEPGPLTPMERVRREGPLHPLLGGAPCTRIPSPTLETSPSAIADFIRKAFLTTPCRGLRFG